MNWHRRLDLRPFAVPYLTLFVVSDTVPLYTRVPSIYILNKELNFILDLAGCSRQVNLKVFDVLTASIL